MKSKAAIDLTFDKCCKAIAAFYPIVVLFTYIAAHDLAWAAAAALAALLVSTGSVCNTGSFMTVPL